MCVCVILHSVCVISHSVCVLTHSCVACSIAFCVCSIALCVSIAGGKVVDMTFCTSQNWVACLNSNDSINLINIETGDQSGAVFNIKETHSADFDAYGHIVALSSTEHGMEISRI